MILVTGAAGKTGRAVIAASADQGSVVRALVHRPEHEDLVRAAGAADVQVGDQRDARVLADALRGIAAVYHIAPNVHPDEVLMGERFLTACRLHRVRRVVYHSVIHPQIEAMPHHWNKLQVEQQLVASEAEWTILRPAPYLQNVLAYLDEVRETGRYRVPYDTTRPAWMVDLADVADVAASTLVEERHVYGAYDLSGPEGLAADGVAATLQRHLDRTVVAERVDPDVWRDGDARDLPPPARDTLHAMFRHYDDHGVPGNPTVLAALLGRRPCDLEDVLRREIGTTGDGST